MSGSHYRKLLADTTGGSSSTTKPGVKSKTSNNKPLPTTRPGCKLLLALPVPDTGLLLNSHAASAEDKVTKGQPLTCRSHLISSSTTASFNAMISDAKHLTTEMASEVPIKEETDEQNNGFQVSENVSENSILVEDVEFPLSSPKKRRISDIMGETESCKHCNCKKSKCLKLYCECFAAGFYCVEPCNCQDCFNKPIHEDTVLGARRLAESRNPLAFAPKVIRSSNTPNNMDELSKTPASAHNKGCNCRKSGCFKKYCECFRVGVGCSLSCRCEGCKNTFGCKENKENHDSVTPELLKNTSL